MGPWAPALAHHPGAALPEAYVAAVGDAKPPLIAVLTMISAEEDSAACSAGTRVGRTSARMAVDLSPVPRRDI